MNIKRIDPHVHCRDGSQSYKETIAHVFDIANIEGIKKIVDMPNTDPPILYRSNVAERLKLVPATQRGNYFLYVGLTSNEEQIKEAMQAYENFPEVIGFKLYAGESTGNLGIINPQEQFEIYEVLTRLKYEGVLAVHCEKKKLLRPDLWNIHNPKSHSWARPKQAEIEAVRDQVRFVNRSHFRGILHIVHVSCPESVALIKEARKNIRITCEATPHHLLFSEELQVCSGGHCYKVNPPLRSLSDIEALRHCVLRGEVDWIATDHAPHAMGEKMFSSNPPSGIPSLYIYGKLVNEFLPKVGASSELIEQMTYHNIIKAFENKIGGEKQ